MSTNDGYDDQVVTTDENKTDDPSHVVIFFYDGGCGV